MMLKVELSNAFDHELMSSQYFESIVSPTRKIVKFPLKNLMMCVKI